MVFAFANAQLKRMEETLRSLGKSYQQRSPELGFVQNDPNSDPNNDPNYDFVHSDPLYRHHKNDGPAPGRTEGSSALPHTEVNLRGETPSELSAWIRTVNRQRHPNQSGIR
jgi:hypothetical protein